MQQKSFWVRVGVDLAQREKHWAFGIDGDHESYSWINSRGTNRIGDMALSPAHTSVVLLTDPSLIDVDDSFALTEKIDHQLTELVPQDYFLSCIS